MIAQTPPMGWNSWDCYGAAVTEADVRRNAKYMAEHLKPFGWEYVVVDIQWYQPTAVNHQYEPFSALTMDEYGRLTPALNRFPSAAGGAGFKPLADYVHSLGLKFGIHIMRGMPRMAAHNRLPIHSSSHFCHQAADPNSICAWNPDMYGLKCETEAACAYYKSIFALYAQWGVDFVKCDDIAREYPHCEKEIELISACCRGCGRDMVLSLSPGPAPLERAEHLKQYANMWRITDDFWDRWDLLKNMFERAGKWCIHAGPGRWPDADMLPVGALRQCDNPDEWTHFTQAEQRTMMTLWSMMRSPLMIGAELSKTDDFTLNLLTNAGVLAIGKESCCGHPLHTTQDESVWIAPRQDGTGVYAALFNLSDSPREVRMPLANVSTQRRCITELWSGRRQDISDTLSAFLPAHDAAVFLLKT
ncbi:MAG: glycoside hydrolase family 27 protein [Clostridiales bacterium]|nr:glycoside hydrolase family 27 protein [Clostridiales bacterium]